MIIFWHFLIHGGVIDNANESLSIIIIFIRCLIYIHVNTFILATGYFRCDTRFKMSKIIQLNNSIWFYKAIIPLILIFFGLITLDKITLFKLLIPIHTSGYWFITCYIYLYLLSPILNIVINNINKQNFKKFIILLFIIFSFLPFITNNGIYNTHDGYSLLQFIILYFIGAYLKKYKIENNYYFRNFTLNAKRIILFSFYLIIGIMFGFVCVATSFYSFNGIIGVVFKTISNSIGSYSNPFIIIESILFFLFFSLLNIKSKMINILSSTTIGIYLIHDNMYLSSFIYQFFGFDKQIYHVSILIKIFVCTVLVFFICFIVEYLRQKIFKFIYNRKISIKFRLWYRNFINSLGVKINW